MLLRFWRGGADTECEKRAGSLVFRSLDGNYLFGLGHNCPTVNKYQDKTVS